MVEYRLNEEGILVEVDTSLESTSDLNVAESTSEEINFGQEITLENNSEEFLPVERGFWSKFSEFFKEFSFSNIFPRISFELELSDYEKKVFGEVRDFWSQDIRELFGKNDIEM